MLHVCAFVGWTRVVVFCLVEEMWVRRPPKSVRIIFGLPFYIVSLATIECACSGLSQPTARSDAAAYWCCCVCWFEQQNYQQHDGWKLSLQVSVSQNADMAESCCIGRSSNRFLQLTIYCPVCNKTAGLEWIQKDWWWMDSWVCIQGAFTLFHLIGTVQFSSVQMRWDDVMWTWLKRKEETWRNQRIGKIVAEQCWMWVDIDRTVSC